MKYLLPVLITVIIVLPGVNLAGIPLKGEDFLVVFFLLSTLGKNKGNFIISNEFSSLLKVFFVFIACNFFSLLLAVFRGYDAVFQDVNTILLYTKSSIFLIAGYFIGQQFNNKNSNFLLYSFGGGILLSSILSIVQYFDIGGLGTSSYLLYGDETRIKYGIDRVIGTFGNPNYASYFHTIGFIIALNIKTFNKRDLLYKYIFMIFTFLGVVLTFSRTGIFALLIVWIITLLLQKKGKKVISLFLVLFILIVYFLETIFQKTRFSRIFSGEHGGTITDFGNRSNLIWEHRFSSFYDSPLFGKGPAKNELSETIFSSTIYDNVFLLLIITSGIVGLVLYLVLFYKMGKPFIKIKSKNYQISNLMIPVFILTFLFFMTTDLIWDISFVGYFYLIVGICSSQIIKQKKYATTNQIIKQKKYATTN